MEMDAPGGLARDLLVASDYPPRRAMEPSTGLATVGHHSNIRFTIRRRARGAVNVDRHRLVAIVGSPLRRAIVSRLPSRTTTTMVDRRDVRPRMRTVRHLVAVVLAGTGRLTAKVMDQGPRSRMIDGADSEVRPGVVVVHRRAVNGGTGLNPVLSTVHLAWRHFWSSLRKLRRITDGA